MGNFNLNSRFNPPRPAAVTPQEYEKQVVNWLESSGAELCQFKVNNLKHLSGDSGDYEFDAVAEFVILQGAKIVVLIECKRYSRPVERDHLMTLWAKLQDVNAQKAMMFSTCGFQSGALEYAKSKNIATVTFVEGKSLYETKSVGSSDYTHAPPPWVNLPTFAAILVSYENGAISCTQLNKDYISLIKDWIYS